MKRNGAKPRMDQDILQADPKHRSRVLALMLLTALLGLLGLYWMQGELRGLPQLLQSSPEEGAKRFLFLTRLVCGLMALGFVAMGAYLLRLSWRALQSETFPPLDTRVLRDTPILRGQPARAKAKIGLVLAFLVLVLGLFVPYRMERKFERFIEGELRRVNTVPRELYLG